VSSKTHLLKGMFLAAVACPNPHHHFSGDIGIWAVTTTKTAKRTSASHKAGDVYEVACNMDRAKFIDMMQELVVPAALRKCGAWSRQIVFQFDNAGGHGGGRGDIQKSSIDILNQWVASRPQDLLDCCNGSLPVIVFVAQPPRSPDLNVLDLGAWHSLQVAVDKFKHDNEVCANNVAELRKLVLETWKSWVEANDAASTLASLFTTLLRVCRLIKEADGGNSYQYNRLHRKKTASQPLFAEHPDTPAA